MKKTEVVSARMLQEVKEWNEDRVKVNLGIEPSKYDLGGLQDQKR